MAWHGMAWHIPVAWDEMTFTTVAQMPMTKHSGTVSLMSRPEHRMDIALFLLAGTTSPFIELMDRGMRYTRTHTKRLILGDSQTRPIFLLLLR